MQQAKELAVLGKAKDKRSRHDHPGDGAQNTVKAFGENETAIRLRHDEHCQESPARFIERGPVMR
jgi:hypothetical protein